MKLWKLFLVAALALVTVLTMVACGSSCEHVYDEGAVTTEATCAAEGVKTFTCTLCGEAKTESIPVIDHTYAEKATPATCTEPGIMTSTCTACGYATTREYAQATGHSHVAIVTPATCQEGGFTLYTCTCGDSYKGDETPKSGAHNYSVVLEPMTDEQKAKNPDAIGIEALECVDCGEKTVTENAALVLMNFDEVPENIDDYVGSAGYQTAGFPKKAATQKAAGVYLDSQEHTEMVNTSDAWATFEMKGDGVLTKLAGLGMFNQDFGLGGANPTFENSTVAFDITVNKTLAGYNDGKFKTYNLFFALSKAKGFYDCHPFALCLDTANLEEDTAAGTVTAELVVMSRIGSGQGANDTFDPQPTGYKMTVGKEYSFKIDFVTIPFEKMHQATIYAKAAGEADYTEVGTFEFKFYSGSDGSAICFGINQSANGNIIDNYRFTVPLVK